MARNLKDRLTRLPEVYMGGLLKKIRSFMAYSVTSEESEFCVKFKRAYNKEGEPQGYIVEIREMRQARVGHSAKVKTEFAYLGADLVPSDVGLHVLAIPSESIRPGMSHEILGWLGDGTLAPNAEEHSKVVPWTHPGKIQTLPPMSWDSPKAPEQKNLNANLEDSDGDAVQFLRLVPDEDDVPHE